MGAIIPFIIIAAESLLETWNIKCRGLQGGQHVVARSDELPENDETGHINFYSSR